MNRRELFDPRHAAQVTGHVLGALHPDVEGGDDVSEDLALVRLGWRAMATSWEIALPFDTPRTLALGQDLFTFLDTLEDQLTVYRDHSEVSRLNRHAARRCVRVEPGLFGLLELSGQLSRETEGAFDVTTGALIKAWGFFRGPRRVPAEDERLQALQCVGSQHVELDPVRRSVRYHRPGLEINLGSIGKGYALDRLVERANSRWNLPAALLHGGRSSVYAKGDPQGSGRGWHVRIRHPWIPGRCLADLWLRDRALGTSAATFQYLEHEGRKLGHILDPRTGWPASGLASVSVVASSGALADALSTGFYVGGVELARQYCQAHPEVGVVLLPEGASSPIVLNLSPDECAPVGRSR